MREIALHVLDIVENSIKANATLVEITVEEDTVSDKLTVTIRDNGRGMGQEEMASALDPFFTTKTCRRVGLGLPLFAAAARQCDGDFRIESAPNSGTTVEAVFRRSHIDRVPLGDMRSTLISLIAANENLDIHYTRRVDGSSFELDTRQLRGELGEVPLSDPLVLNWIDRYLAEDPQDTLISSL